MLTERMLRHVLAEEALTRGLGDAEARVLIEWLVDWVERQPASAEAVAWAHLRRRCLRARALARFVWLWCYQRASGPAHQFAAAERFAFPLPHPGADPCDLMLQILGWEDEHPEERAPA